MSEKNKIKERKNLNLEQKNELKWYSKIFLIVIYEST